MDKARVRDSKATLQTEACEMKPFQMSKARIRDLIAALQIEASELMESLQTGEILILKFVAIPHIQFCCIRKSSNNRLQFNVADIAF